MTQRYIYFISEADSDPVRKHVMLALLQADQENQSDVVFGKLCSTCEPIFHWRLVGGGGICSIAPPTGVSGIQVGQTLTSMIGFDCAGEFPRQSELTIEAGDTRSN